jgi:DNA (cytosine-5)-methyltransferase 1
MVDYCCEKCEHKFSKKSDYNTHLKIHSCIHIIKPQNENKKDKIKYVDLFCGIGSFHYSFKTNNWECIMACDISKSARETYKKNYGMEPMKDICDIEPKKINKYHILCAGFPCQPFSQAGKHKGFDDDRGTMFFQVMKFVKYHNPPIVLLENVQGLLNHNEGKSFKKIKDDIEKENYKVYYKVLTCSDYGIPQMRKRLFLFCVKNNIKIKKNKDIENIFILKDYEKSCNLSEYLNKNFKKKYAYTIRCGGKNSPINDKHNWDGYYVDDKEYRLTLKDCLKLQGFNNDFELCGTDKEKWILLGNTIPTIFTEIIGKQIKKFISLI